MREFLKSMKISFILAAVLYVALGLVLLIWPGTSITLLCYAFGAVLLAYAAITIISFFVHDSALGTFRFELFLGIVAATLGILFLVQPAFIMSIVPVILGVYIAIDSLVNLKRAIELFRLEYPRWWVVLLLSLLGVGLGVVVLCRPFAVAETLFMLIGAVFVFTGASDLWTIFKVSRVTRELRRRAPIEVDPIDIE